MEHVKDIFIFYYFSAYVLDNHMANGSFIEVCKLEVLSFIIDQVQDSQCAMSLLISSLFNL